MADEKSNRKVDIIIKEWDHVQFHIGRLDTIVFTIRQWCFTLLSAFLAASVTIHRPILMICAIVPTLFFWLSDALYKAVQRRFIIRGSEIEDYLSSDLFSRFLADQTADEFVAPRLSTGQFDKRDFLERLRAVGGAARLPNVLMAYLPALSVCVLAYLLLRNL